MFAPRAKLNGAVIKVVKGTVHCVEVTITEEEPSQLVSSVANVLSDFLM
jgi:hypothetical protein